MQKAVNEDTMLYVQEIKESYRPMKERTIHFEKRTASFWKLGGVNIRAFLPDNIPSEDVFVEPDIPPTDRAVVNAYLREKERVYLLERGIGILEDDDIRNIAKESFWE